MTSPILVTGGTGTLGRQVVSRLQEAGREVRVLSRRSRSSQDDLVFVTGDLATGEGLAAAVRGIGTIVHCASNRKGDAQATRNLVRAAAQEKSSQQKSSQQKSSQATSPHLVYISIVGIDRFPRGYFKTKLEAEGVIGDSGLPSTTLRATQFYELIRNGAVRLAKLPVIPVPAGFVVQPVDSGEVAARLAELALGEPRGRVPDMAGPQVLSFADVIRIYLQATGRRPRQVVKIWTLGIGPIRAGALYPRPGTEVTLGRRSWLDFLASSPARAAAPSSTDPDRRGSGPRLGARRRPWPGPPSRPPR